MTSASLHLFTRIKPFFYNQHNKNHWWIHLFWWLSENNRLMWCYVTVWSRRWAVFLYRSEPELCITKHQVSNAAASSSSSGCVTESAVVLSFKRWLSGCFSTPPHGSGTGLGLGWVGLTSFWYFLTVWVETLWPRRTESKYFYPQLGNRTF